MAILGSIGISLFADSASLRSDMAKAQRSVRSSSARMNKALASTQKRFRSMGKSARRAAKSMFTLRGAATALAGGTGLGFLIKIAADFEEAMSEVKAITRGTAEEMGLLEEKARALGSTTRFTATEVAKGMTFLARAGFETNEILESIEGNLNLAAAGHLDLAEAADISSNIMQAFNVTSKETARFVDVLAESAASTNTDIRQMGEAMSLVAPIADSMGISVEETAAAIGTLSDAGLQATRAGTGFRAVLAKLADPSDRLRKLMNGLTVETDGLQAVVDQLASQSLSAGDAISLFGIRGGNAFTLLGRGAGKLDELTVKFNNLDDVARKMAETMDDNLKGSFKILGSAASELILTLDEKTGLTGIIQKMNLAIAENIALFAKFLGRDEQQKDIAKLAVVNRQLQVRTTSPLNKFDPLFRAQTRRIKLQRDELLARISNRIEAKKLTAEIKKTADEQKKLVDTIPIPGQKPDIVKPVPIPGQKPDFELSLPDPEEIEDTTDSIISAKRAVIDFGDSTKRTNSALSVFSDELFLLGTNFQDWRNIAVNAIQDVLRSMLSLSRGGGATGGIGGSIASGLFNLIGGASFVSSSGTAGFSSRSFGSLALSAAGGKFGPGFAKGGISNRPAVFGEAGPEAAVPLPDGRSIPVTLSGGGGGGPMVFIDARGADREGLTRLENIIKRLNGSIEERSINAVQSQFQRSNSFLRA